MDPNHSEWYVFLEPSTLERPKQPSNMDRLLAVAHAYHRALLKPHTSMTTSRFWCNRLFEIASEMGIPGLEVIERFEAFIAVGYWE